MIDTTNLYLKVIDLAVQGKLTEQLPQDGSAIDLYANIKIEKERLIKEKKVKKLAALPDITTDEIPFVIPNNWVWARWGDVVNIVSARRVRQSDWRKEGVPFYRAREIAKLADYGKVENDLFISEDLYNEFSKNGVPKTGDLMVSAVGTLGKTYVVEETDRFYYKDASVICFENFGKLNSYYLKILMESSLMHNQIKGNSGGTTVDTLTMVRMNAYLLPIPPIDEQKRIVEAVGKIAETVSYIEELQAAYSSDLEVLKSKIIDAGIQGKLTEQLPEDGNAEDLYAAIQEDIGEGEKILPIPDNWQWIKLGWAMDIERGGSPRPIKTFMTDAEDGINWIKIGDVAKDGKYITQTKERIKPEGEKKSRKVVPGDFLLTNSMSFGRPYISKIYGCIHDGWLLLRNSKGIFDLDYLYYLLSSKYVYDQFSKKASGATVDNLNKEKVASAVIPLPPISEQIRIAEIIEKTLSMI